MDIKVHAGYPFQLANDNYFRNEVLPCAFSTTIRTGCETLIFHFNKQKLLDAQKTCA